MTGTIGKSGSPGAKQELGAELRSIADTLLSARRDARALPAFPGQLPDTFEDAYAIQNYSRHAWPDEVGAWKVGGVPPGPYRERFGVDRLVGPVFSRAIHHVGEGEVAEFPVYPGSAAVEGEFVFQLGANPGEERMFIGVELASSPVPAINSLGPVAVICDFGNNGGLLVGQEIKNWRDIDAGSIDLETLIDGEVVGTRTLTNFPKDALDALAFLRAHAEKHSIDLPQDSLVTSGAITGVHETRSGVSAVCRFGQFGEIQLKLVPAKPFAG
ncbi:hypothetical protein [Altererythrobacter sp. ZODW24]|uniref:2-keto-4-pentenoate hydratase n=1 Tax=Altererythrobacter sp. ZODW24 TaxID=2185142 RepID=UPI000DF7D488|nr:hypothetical protein [Altererythrobacter sp. ZODW24]